MKPQFLKNSLPFCFLAALTLLGSCGGKTANKVNSNAATGASPFYTGNAALNSAAGSTIIAQVQSIRQSTPCVSGGYRLTNDVSFYVTGGTASQTTFSGQFQSGFLTNGTISTLNVGVSPFGDLMFVTKVTNGAQVVGFNVTLSFCELKSNTGGYTGYGGYGGYPSGGSVISNERALVNFQAPYGITITTSARCGYGVANATGPGSAAGTYIISQRNMSNPTSAPDAQVPTSFAPPRCNY